jgi:hypothetical protein
LIVIAEPAVSDTNVQMQRITSIVWAVVVLALPQFNALAWSGAGHLVIAAEAFRQLSPELKAEASEVLKAHPDYVKWART